MKNKRFFIIGVAGGLGLLVLYFAVLTLANSFSHAISQFSQFWYWILILVAGFGTQVGLYAFIKTRQKVSGGVLAASGSVSTGSMIACCLHHLADVLPLMGLAAAALFLIKYQLFFIILGILSNLAGITIMLRIIKKNQLTANLKKGVIGLSLILLPTTFLLINNSEDKINPIITLSGKTSTQVGVSFEVTPKNFNFEKPVEFEIKIDTHSGSLDFDITNISLLEDNLGNQYLPLAWQGSEPGGHHREGVLSFPEINSLASKMELIINATPQRLFEWEIK